MFMKSFFFTATTAANGSVIKLFSEIYCDFIEMEKKTTLWDFKGFFNALH